ncbi:helix-turn-helix transcriptional regulator, partial [Erysipelatoclostridium ramosum]
MEIGERLKKLRIKRKLTQFEVEELTGINRSTLSL